MVAVQLWRRRSTVLVALAVVLTLAVVLWWALPRDSEPSGRPVAPARILVVSDSLAEGQGEVSSITATWPHLLGAALRADHDLAERTGGTWLPASVSGEEVRFGGPTGSGEPMGDRTGVPGALGGGPLTWRTEEYDAARVHVAALEPGVEFTAQVDDDEPITFTSTGAGPAGFEIPETGAELTVAGDGAILGVEGQVGDPTDGVRVVNLSWSGSSTSDWLGRLNSPELLPFIEDLDPDLVILSLGGNDYWRDLTVERFGAHLRRIHDLVAAMAPDAGWLLGTQPLPDQTENEGWSARQQVTREYAAELGAPLIDLHTAMPSAAERPELYSADRIHLTDAGHALIAETAYRALRTEGRWRR